MLSLGRNISVICMFNFTKNYKAQKEEEDGWGEEKGLFFENNILKLIEGRGNYWLKISCRSGVVAQW